MGIVSAVKDWAEGFIAAGGYPGLMVLCFLGNANIPVPSEAVLPFGGLLVARGRFDLHAVAWLGTLASVLGSLASYAFGAWLGKGFLLKYGKYVLMRTSEIEHAERWFERYGLQVTLWGRFVPVVRSFVSLPAGMVRSNLAVFTLYSFLGSLPWCYGWTYVGFKVGEHWKDLERNMQLVNLAVVLLLGILFAKVLVDRKRRRQLAGEDRLE